MIGHRIGPEDGFFILHLKIPELELVPVALEHIFRMAKVGVWRNVHRIEVNGGCRHIDLDITTRFKLQLFAGRQLQHKFLDKCGDVIVGNHFTLPLLDSKYFVWYANVKILLDLDLATKPYMTFLFGTGQVAHLSWKDISTSTFHYTLAHGTSAAAAAGRRKKYFFVR